MPIKVVIADDHEVVRRGLVSLLAGTEAKVVGDKFGTHMYPETWVIDPHGVIRARFDGARDWSNAMVLDLVRSLALPASFPAEVQGGHPVVGSPLVCGLPEG